MYARRFAPATCHPQRRAICKQGLCSDCWTDFQTECEMRVYTKGAREMNCNRCDKRFQSFDPSINRRCPACAKTLSVHADLDDNYLYAT